MISKEFNLLQSIVYSVATAIGFALALMLFAGIRERLELEDVPKAVQGVPVALITAGILAMASWVSPGWYRRESKIIGLSGSSWATPIFFYFCMLRFDVLKRLMEKWRNRSSIYGCSVCGTRCSALPEAS